MRDQGRRRRREKVQQDRLEEMGERRFAYRAEREACDGDAELAGGEHRVEPVQRAQHGPGPALFAAANVSIFERRTLTSANSTATKNPFANTRTRTASILRNTQNIEGEAL